MVCLWWRIDSVFYVFFFFQAEDGIRDVAVTGVQTCALPIFVEMEEANVFVPRRALRFAELWLDDQKRWIAVARKNNQVISLHGPVVRQVKNVVRRADHQRIEMVLLQHLPHALPLLFVDGIAHLATAFSLPW